MNNTKLDHSNKSILARGCDPYLSKRAAEFIPPLLGHPIYVPTTNDHDFIEKLKSQKWSVIYFAPGACRYSAARKQIPGGIEDTRGWTLEQYRHLVHTIQGQDIQIVESVYEEGAIELLAAALEKARSIEEISNTINIL